MLKYSIVTGLLMFSIQTNRAQKVYNYNTPGTNCYCEMLFKKAVSDPKGVLVLDVGEKNIQEFSKNNYFSDSNILDHYSRLYIKILNQGVENRAECYDVVINTISLTYNIFHDVFYVILDANQIRKYSIPILNSYKFTLISVSNYDSLKSILDESTLFKRYNFPSSYFKSELEKRMENYKGNLNVGLVYAPTLLMSNTNLFNGNWFNSYGLFLNKHFSQHSSLELGLNLSFKKPNQKEIQSGMQSKIMQAVQNGKDTLYINESLKGHVFFGGNISYRYYFNGNRNVRTYLSLGIGFYNFTKIEGSIYDTIDLRNVNTANPSSLQNFNNLGASSPSLGRSNIRYFSNIVEFGLDARISPVAKFSISFPLSYAFYVSEPNMRIAMFNFNLGLSFCLNSGKYPIAKLNNKK